MDASSHASWSRIPRDYHEQQRVQLEHRLFASTAHSNSISDDSFNLEEEGDPNNLNMNSDSDNDNEANGRQLRYSSSEFSMEYPRNPQVAGDDYSLSNPYHRDAQPREGDTKSTFAHHASGITFRTGLRGPSHSRRRDFSGGDLSRGMSDLSFDYDPDRPLDALLRRAGDLSILQDSPRDAPKSEFTTRAQGLAKQMAGNSQENSYQAPSAMASRNKDGSFAANVTIKPTHKPLSDLARTANTPLKSTFATTRVFPAYIPTTGKAGIQLPDVTGITSAVATPLKGDASFRRVPDPKPASTLTTRFSRQQKVAQPSSSKQTGPASGESAPANPTAVLDTLSSRLHQIERESLTSRRRVSELERELDLCRTVVDLERSRMGELSMRAERKQRARRGQGSFSRDGRTTNAQNVPELDAAVLDASFRETQRRYREAVGEEKELEALVKALHAHLRRTSATVESHKQMINDIRAEAAQAAQQQKRHERRPSSSRVPSGSQEADKIWDEVERVKSEVELLWGDVGRLRGVVEGGLGVRRSREGGFIGRPSDGPDFITGSIVRGESLRDMSDEEGSTESREEEQLSNHNQQPEEQLQAEPVEDMQRPEWGAPVLSAVLEEDEPPSTRASTRSTTQPPHAPGRFIQDAELERVRAEVEERRSLRSMSTSGSDRSGNGSGAGLRTRALDRVLGSATGGRISPKPDSAHTRVPSSLSNSRLPTGSRNGLQQHTPPRPLTPESEGDDPSFVTKDSVQQQQQQTRASERARQADKDTQRASSPLSPALPQIRGERLEQLFYAAPEHNSRTCRVCHRRRRTDGPTSVGPTVPTNADGEVKFCAGDERRIAEIAKQSGVPPQTVLARVLRELEDDFTHYKSIYVELADQYKAMDAASDMGKRNLLANHLREVIDILEQKGDQIASLYDLLHFEDKPIVNSVPIASSSRHHHHHHTHGRRTRLS